MMEYMLYTTVDITNTGKYRSDQDSEPQRWKEQNFQTVLQTMGIRANVSYHRSPDIVEMKGKLMGFETDTVIRAWRFDFYTEREHLFGDDREPVQYLIDDFDAVPYIAGLDECMEQNYNVFVTAGPARNIIFYLKS
jgi:hypothetical protein